MDERVRRPGADAASRPTLAERVRALFGRSTTPPLPRPRVPRYDPVGRFWIAAFWQARVSVHAGVPLDDFLRSRLARYLAGLTMPRARLPLAIEIDDGRVDVRAAAPEPPRAPPPDDEARLRALIEAEGPSVRQEATELEIRLAVLDGEIEAARRRSDDLSRKLAADVADGIVAAPPAVEASAEQMGRPPIRSAAPRTAALALATAAVASETWQIALPLLRSAGVDPTSLAAEAARAPGDIVFASVFALGVAAGLFALAHAGLEAAGALLSDGADARRRRWLGGGALGAAALAILVATAIARLPPGSAPGTPAASLALLLLAVPVGTGLLLRAARRHERERAADADAALAWDRERARALADRARRLEEVSSAEEALHRLGRQRDAARRRLRELDARAVAAARLLADAERRERAALARVAQSVVAALELDRWEFVRQACARGALELLAQRRRKPDPRSPVLEPATAPATGVEGGRLAS